jgi:hypothetical protein
MTLTLSIPKEPHVSKIDGATALQFFVGIEKAMDEAGGGRYRAFNLVTALRRIGLGIVAIDAPAVPAEPADHDGE